MRRGWSVGIFYGLVAAVVLLMAAPLFAASSNRADDVSRIKAAARVFRDNTIPEGVLHSAECIGIIPAQKHFALGIGGQYGKGLVTCRNDNRWSAPAFVTLSGVSYGFQIGGQSSDIVLIFRSKHGLESLLSNKIKIGASASAAAGPIGRKASAATNASANAAILTYSRSHGAFAGVNLNGDLFQPDDSGNIAMYGRAERHEQILSGQVPPPPEAIPLLREISRVTAAIPPKPARGGASPTAATPQP